MPLISVGAFPGQEAASTLQCANCNEEIHVADVTSWSSSAWSCKRCRNNYNRQLERNRKCGKLKKWWQGLSPEQKKKWFSEQKLLNPDKWKNKEYAKHEQMDEKAEEDMKHDINDSITQETFVRESMQMG